MKSNTRKLISLILIGMNCSHLCDAMDWVNGTINCINKAVPITRSYTHWVMGKPQDPATLRAEAAKARACLTKFGLESKKTELFKSVESGNSRRVRDLLESGAPVDCKDQNNYTPLIKALVRDQATDQKILKDLIIFGSTGSILDAQDNEGNTALLKAISCNRSLDTVKLLVDAGANVKIADHAHKTSLHKVAELYCTNSDQAIKQKAVDIAQLLINNGAEVPGANSGNFKERLYNILRTHSGKIGATGVGLATVMVFCKSYALINPFFWTFLISGGLAFKEKSQAIRADISNTIAHKASGVIDSYVPSAFGSIIKASINKYMTSQQVQNERVRIEEILIRLGTQA
jgi:hypothetical protein